MQSIEELALTLQLKWSYTGDENTFLIRLLFSCLVPHLRYFEHYLEPHVMSYANFIDNDFIFIARDYLNKADITIMKQSVMNHDMNPIEHLQDEFRRQIRERVPAPETLSQLQNVIQEDSQNMPQYTIVTSIRSINCMQAVNWRILSY